MTPEEERDAARAQTARFRAALQAVQDVDHGHASIVDRQRARNMVTAALAEEAGYVVPSWAEGRAAGIEAMRGPMRDQRELGRTEGATAVKQVLADAMEVVKTKGLPFHNDACEALGELLWNAAEAAHSELRAPPATPEPR